MARFCPCPCPNPGAPTGKAGFGEVPPGSPECSGKVEWGSSQTSTDPRLCQRPTVLQAPPHPQLRLSQDRAAEASKSTRRWRPLSSDLGSIPRGQWMAPRRADPSRSLPTCFSSNVHRSDRGGGEEARFPCNLGVWGREPPHQVCLCLHLVPCPRCRDCTLLLPWDICISWLCNKCCILSGSCSSLGDRERVGEAFGRLLLMSLVSGLGLPCEAPYGMNVNCPLPAASQMPHPRLGPRAGVGRVPPTNDHKSTALGGHSV